MGQQHPISHWLGMSTYIMPVTAYIMYVTLGIIVFMIVVPSIINIIVGAGTRKAKTSFDQRTLFSRLQQATKYNDVELTYGKVKRFNNHFNYKAAHKTLYMPCEYDDKKTVKTAMIMLSNFSNILDMREQKTNFWSRSIWCHILAGYGMVVAIVALLLMVCYDVNGQSNANRMAFNYLLIGLSAVSYLFIITGWIWWIINTNKLVAHVTALANATIENKSEIASIIGYFKLQTIMPFTINTTLPIKRKLEPVNNNKSKDKFSDGLEQVAI